MRVVGIDACRGGWVAVTLTDGGYAGATAAASLGDLFDGTPDAVGIDMPLGLLESGWRECDLLARGLLGPRRSSVFPIPPRAVWAESGYAEAVRACRELTGSGFSIQAWGLRPKLLAANEYRSLHTLFEVHPELAFAAMSSGAPPAQAGRPFQAQAGRPVPAQAGRLVPAQAGRPLPDSKHTTAGRAVRHALLAQAGALPPGTSPPRAVPLTDLLDAAAVAWSARRIATGTAAIVPDPPQRDLDGREIAIRY
jgi:predicted RNase H-like nuclease